MHKWNTPSRHGLDGRKAGKCISILTGETITKAMLKKQAQPKPNPKA